MNSNKVNRGARPIGNSPAVLFNHYRELVSQSDTEAFWSITP